jgi:hypothetical protein
VGSLKFALRIVSKVLHSCLCLFEVSANLCVMDEECSMTFSLESESEFYMQ